MHFNYSSFTYCRWHVSLISFFGTMSHISLESSPYSSISRKHPKCESMLLWYQGCLQISNMCGTSSVWSPDSLPLRYVEYGFFQKEELFPCQYSSVYLGFVFKLLLKSLSLSTCLNMVFQCVVQVNSSRALKSYWWHQNGFLNVQAMELTLERSLMSMMIHVIHCMTCIPPLRALVVPQRQ